MTSPLRPGPFCAYLLQALDASHGRTKRRKRDQTADTIGLGIKRDLLERAAAEDPEPDEFEAWLMMQAMAAPASGPIRAMCAEIFDEYRLARAQPRFSEWLAAGAPSEDADRGDARPKSDAEVSGGAALRPPDA